MSDRRVSSGPSEPVHITGVDGDVSLSSVSSLEPLGEEHVTGSGTHTATLPEGTTFVVLVAMKDTVRWAANAVASIESFPVMVGIYHSVGPMYNMTSLSLFLTSKSEAYLQYYRVVPGETTPMGGGGVRIGLG